MKRIALVLAATLAGTMMAPVQAQTPTETPASRALHALFAEEWERNLRDFPVGASYQGDTRYDDRWADMSLAAIAAREAADRAALQRLRAIDRAALAPADQLDRDTFEWELAHG